MLVNFIGGRDISARDSRIQKRLERPKSIQSIYSIVFNQIRIGNTCNSSFHPNSVHGAAAGLPIQFIKQVRKAIYVYKWREYA